MEKQIMRFMSEFPTLHSSAQQTRPTRSAHLAGLTLVLLALFFSATASATPVTYSFQTGYASIYATIEGTNTSIYASPGSIPVELASATAVVDEAALAFGSLDSFSIVTTAFNVDLDPFLTGLNSVSVSSATLTSTSASALSNLGQFVASTEMSALLSAEISGGGTFGPATVTSQPGTTAGLVALSADSILLRLSGVAVATFEQVGNPNIVVTADFAFVGQAPATPIPEPGAALVFGLGITVAGTFVGRRQG
jgi:hypothetical protein